MTAPILYVEDEEDYQILVKRILKRAGLEVEIAQTGAEGYKALERERPSLLILDINLPDTDGYAICDHLRQDPVWADLPILMLTVRRRPEEWLRGFSSGANDYISKPLNPPELIERVVSCLEGKAHQFTSKGTAEYSLIQAAVSGNRAAFEVLIQKYRDRLVESLRVSANNDAQVEDAVSHAFALAFENLREFRGEASFYTWVYRIALNEFMYARRRPGAISLDELADGEDSHLLAASVDSKPLEQVVADGEINRRALEALDRVPEPYRLVLEMYFLQDLPYETIARKLRIPEGTVMSRLHKARRLLQEAWKLRPLPVLDSN
jgi:RNA polymerase sigma factor (sigma-70 family)